MSTKSCPACGESFRKGKRRGSSERAYEHAVVALAREAEQG